MSFAREYLLLKYNSGASKYAFEVQVREYSGGTQTNPLQVSRNLDADLLIVRGTSKREFVGVIFADSSASGSVQYETHVPGVYETYTLGTDTDLKACLDATDLVAKSFEDDTFWDAQSVLPYSPLVEFGHNGMVRTVRVRLLEK